MAYIILPHRWRRQPPAGTPLASNYLRGAPKTNASTTVGYANFNFADTRYAKDGSAAGKAGVGLKIVDDSGFDTGWKPCYIYSDTFPNTSLFLVEIRADVSYNYCILDGATHISLRHSSYGNRLIGYGWNTLDSGYSLTIGRPTVLAIRHSYRDASYHNSDVFIEGRNPLNTYTTGSSSGTTFAAYAGTTADVLIYGFVGLPYGLSDDELLQITRSPENFWDLYQPLQRRIYVPSAGGGITAGSFVAAAGAATAATMAGASTSAASFSVAAGVATAGTLAGASTAATAFSAASGVATAATLAGASVAAASFSVAAGVATAGTLTGASTAAVSFTAAAGVATAATMVGDALAQGAAAFVAASGVATTSTMQGASTAAADFTPASGLATTGLLQGVGLITVSADFVAAAGIATTATMAGADANTVPVAGQGGGAGYPYDYSDLKRTKSTRERIKEILDDAAEGMEEAVKGVPVVEALRRPVDAAGMARKMTRKPAPIGLPPPDDEDDDFLLLSH